MKHAAAIAIVLLLGGCATNHSQPPAVEAELAAHHYEAASASALAFDAPISADYPLPGLDRSDRQPSAYVGYDQGSIEFYSIGMMDDQSDPFCSTYDRWSYTERVGTMVH